MARLFRLVMMAALAGLLASPCLAASSRGMNKGFGEAVWGGDVSQIQGFMKLRSQDGIDYYVNLREKYVMKGFDKPIVYYGQAGGRLYAVHLRLKDDSGYDKLLAELRRNYGPGKKSHEGATQVVSFKAGAIRVKLKKDPAGETKLSFYYQPVAITLSSSQREADLGGVDVVSLLPKDTLQIDVPPGAIPPKPTVQEGIDVLKYLKEGSKLLRMDLPGYGPVP